MDFSKPPEETYLPLEIFDDSKFEVRPTEEWIELGSEITDPKKAVACVVPGYCLKHNKDGTGAWKPCQMINFDAESGKFVVR